MIIEGEDCTLLKDYDKGKYGRLTFNGKVTYLKERVEFILLQGLPASESKKEDRSRAVVLLSG
jgi:hypothetical protein